MKKLEKPLGIMLAGALILTTALVFKDRAGARPRDDEAVAKTVSQEEKADLDVFLAELEEYGRKHRMMNVPRDHGRFLQLMTELKEAKRVLEIGTSNGYSSLWIGKGLRATGGELITIEYDEQRGGEAKANFAKTGFDGHHPSAHRRRLQGDPHAEGALST